MDECTGEFLKARWFPFVKATERTGLKEVYRGFASNISLSRASCGARICS